MATRPAWNETLQQAIKRNDDLPEYLGGKGGFEKKIAALEQQVERLTNGPRITQPEKMFVLDDAGRELCVADMLRDHGKMEAQLTEARDQLADAESAIERDRTNICDAVNGLKKVLDGRDWLGESRGPYEWDDDRWHREFVETATEIRQAVEPLVKIAADLSSSPRTQESVLVARQSNDWLREQLRQAQALADIYSEQAIRWQADAATITAQLAEVKAELTHVQLVADAIQHSSTGHGDARIINQKLAEVDTLRQSLAEATSERDTQRDKIADLCFMLKEAEGRVADIE